MARRSRSNRNRTANPSAIASRVRLVRMPLRLLPVPVASPLLGDRRTYHPLREFRPPRTVGARSAARIKLKSVRGPDVLGFSVPRKVSICIRRKDRREVLFAKRFTGRGARSPKRRNYYSAISCR